MATKSEEAYQVIFATTALASAGPGQIVVAPLNDSWNDFGFRARVDIVIHPRSRDGQRPIDNIRLRGFLGILDGEDSDTRALRQMLAGVPDGQLSAEGAPDFFTMLLDMAAYRQVVSELGPSEAQLALMALRDIVEAENNAAIGRPWLKAATESQVFQQAFLRSSEAFFAWKNAAMVLRGVEFERVGLISEELRLDFQLAGRPNPHHLEFRFALHDEVLPKRFVVLIGKNGVGKSQALARTADAAIRGSPTLTDGHGGRPSFNRIIAFYSDVASRVFPGEQRRRSKVWYRRFSLGSSGYGHRRQTTADLIVQLARAPERIRDQYRYDIFRKAILAIERHEELALVSRDPGERTVLLEWLLRGGEQELLNRFSSIDTSRDVVRLTADKEWPLSSGELGFVRFAALASLHIENSSLLLLDEPETHLHPNFISQFVVLLDNLLAETGSAAIIATHSVYFVREAFEDQVRVLRSGPDREITVETPILRTFGADVGAISYFVFGEDEPSRLAKAVEQRIADREPSWEKVFEEYKDRLSLDLLGEIRAEIEDRDGSVAPA